MLLKANLQPQEADMSLNIYTVSRQVTSSMPQPTFQFIEGPVMDWSVGNSLYSRFKTWQVTYENILKVELASMPSTRNCKTFPR